MSPEPVKAWAFVIDGRIDPETVQSIQPKNLGIPVYIVPAEMWEDKNES